MKISALMVTNKLKYRYQNGKKIIRRQELKLNRKLRQFTKHSSWKDSLWITNLRGLNSYHIYGGKEESFLSTKSVITTLLDVFIQ